MEEDGGRPQEDVRRTRGNQVLKLCESWVGGCLPLELVSCRIAEIWSCRCIKQRLVFLHSSCF